MAIEFGKKMRSIREERNWTLEEMAEILGTTKQALSKYERGERTPKITVASKFAEKLGVDLRVLVGENGETELELANPGEDITPKTDEAKIISGGIDKMPPERREQALKVLQTIFAEYFDGGERDGT